MDNSDRFDVEEEFLFIGRTFEEYVRLFGLDPVSIAGERVLDCPGGPSAFTAVAGAMGTDAIAVDPMYGRPVGELERECEGAIESNVSQLHEKRDLFVWDYYGDVETRERYLRAAAERFLADYHRHPDRYREGALPHLGFPDDAFDLALSGNLLFLYDDRLDLAFHQEALRELTRVAAEVRVFPPASLDRERSEFVEPVVEELVEDGFEIEFREVPYEFQPGVTQTLVVS